jgi:hypothetical protein
VNITKDIDGFWLGSYSFQIKVFDKSGNNVTDSVMVNVVDTTSPMITSSPTGFTFDFGTTGNNISWNATDLDPGIYELYVNDSLFFWDYWENNTEFSISLDSLAIGYHNCTIVISDGSGNNVTETVFVTVEGIIINEFYQINLGLTFFLFLAALLIYQRRKRISKL